MDQVEFLPLDFAFLQQLHLHPHPQTGRYLHFPKWTSLYLGDLLLLQCRFQVPEHKLHGYLAVAERHRIVPAILVHLKAGDTKLPLLQLASHNGDP